MSTSIETVIIGGGQAGLAASFYLTRQKREHVVLEQAAQAGHAWRDDRWDSFTLVTPNWSFRLPGAEYQGDDPGGFMPRDEIVARFEQYVDRFRLPVRFNTTVTSVERKPDGSGYRVETDGAQYESNNVVVATGLFQRPKLPPFSARLSPDILQLHSGAYRNPLALPPGAVLVVGSAQSGCQIAEELHRSGRQVYLSVGSAGRAPRRYRDRDIFEWLDATRFLDRTVDKLPSPAVRFAGNPHLSGKDGGHAINLHQFARDGMTLLGHIQGADDGQLRFARDLQESLAKIDKFETDLLTMIDAHIAQSGLDAPKEDVPQLRDGYAAAVIEELDLKSAGIHTIIWAMGYSFDFGLVHLPIFEANGFPIQQRGVTEVPGLYFVGLPWMPGQKSGLLLGVGDNAALIAGAIAAKRSVG